MTARRPDTPGAAAPINGQGGQVGHLPVMVGEVIEALALRDSAIYLDGTFGAGGYSRAILDAANCRVWAIDQDPEAIAAGDVLVRSYPGRLHLVQGRFGEMEQLLPGELRGHLDGIAFDLGVSSMQLEQPHRGFSFQREGPLDMRMGGAEGSGRPSAAEVVMTLSERELADILFRFGDERMSRAVARAIVATRKAEPIEGTTQLAAIVRAVVRRGQKRRGETELDPATRTFQALRIYVNDELGELQRGLEAAERMLGPGGRLVVVSFHSLEDRLTKAFLRERSGETARPSRHVPDLLPPFQPEGEGRLATFTQLFRGTKKPSRHEVTVNRRARSARLRAAVRTTAPAWT